MKNERLTIRIKVDIKKQLEEIAKSKGLNMSGYISLLIHEAIKLNDKK